MYKSIKTFSEVTILGGLSILLILLAGCAATPQPTPTAKPPTAPPPEIVKAKKSSEQIRLENIQKADDMALAGKTKEAFEAYMDIFSNDNHSGTGLILRIVSVAKKMTAPPPAPEGLKKQLVFAKMASSEAKDNAGYDRAIQEYQKTVKLAPWMADLYLNLGLAHEKRKNYKNAVTNLQLFLDIALDDPQRKLVQDKIYEMEFLAKDTVRKQENIVKRRQACLSTCSNITQSGTGIVRNQKHCEEIFGSFGHNLTPTRHRRQENCKNLVRNNEACKARC